MKNLLLILTSVFVLGLSNFVQASDCDVEFKTAKVCGKVEWIKGPDLNGENQFKLSLFSNEGVLINSEAPVEVALWMPHHGHGSAPTQVGQMGSEVGQYLVKEIYFVMPGFWEVRVKTTFANQVEIATLSLEL